MQEINLFGIQPKKRIYPDITDEQREALFQFGREYYDDPVFPGYGGYKYDGRWTPVAQRMIDFFGLPDGTKILDIGCAKGFLLHDFKLLNPTFRIRGVDISEYAIENAMPSVRGDLACCDCAKLPYDDSEFDLVLCIDVLHNLDEASCRQAIGEINRVGKEHRFIMVHSYQSKEEKKNLFVGKQRFVCCLTRMGGKKCFGKRDIGEFIGSGFSHRFCLSRKNEILR